MSTGDPGLHNGSASPFDDLPHCPSCRCGARAPVQAETYGSLGRAPVFRPEGSILWWEHERAWAKYAERHGTEQSAERIAERGGFGYGELISLLGREPETWRLR